MSKSTLSFDELTIGEIILILDDGNGNNLCGKWQAFLPFKSNLRAAWDELKKDPDDLEIFADFSELDLTISPAFIDAIKPYIKEDKHEDLPQFLKENFDEDWIKADNADAAFEHFRDLLFDALKDKLNEEYVILVKNNWFYVTY